jgi:D-glucosaminate-6-phosphate ammonia-lyase
MNEMDIFARRGIPTIINAAGTLTRLSGGTMRSEVSTAIAEASSLCVDMAELQAHASAVIATHTGAEAGLVTSGASAGLLLAAAACIAGLDPSKMNRLPDTAGLPAEIIVPRSHRNGYDHALRAAGARLIEVGLPDRYSGAGGRDTEAHEIGAAINANTAAIFYVVHEGAQPPLSEVVALARTKGIPVIVDAAAQLPPQSNLRDFIAQGADLVVFSGGKALGGPQASGILCGSRPLIMSAALQMLDMDVEADQWSPPSAFIDLSMLPGLPRHGIGRSCKAGKEEIIGLLTALELFVAEGDAVRHARWLAELLVIADNLGGQSQAEIIIHGADDITAVPKFELRFADKARALTLAKALLPAIHVDQSLCRSSSVLFNPIGMADGDAKKIVSAVLRLLK